MGPGKSRPSVGSDIHLFLAMNAFFAVLNPELRDWFFAACAVVGAAPVTLLYVFLRRDDKKLLKKRGEKRDPENGRRSIV